MKALNVFTPGGVPTVTYIDRSARQLETNLRNALKTPGMITSLSGPSKSGKTVLIHKVIDPDNLITVSGGAIRSADQLWDRVLNWMDAPSAYTSSRTGTVVGGLSAEGGGGFNVGVAKGDGKIGVSGGYEQARGSETTYARAGIDQVVREIAKSEFVVFIDDFHYMASDIQADVARQIKEAAEKGVTICTASVPHRADDVVRRNTELRGRVQAIDFSYWSIEEIEQIATTGFDALNVDLHPQQIRELAKECFGSPQLMQQICLQACYYLGFDERQVTRERTVFTAEVRKTIFERTSTTADFSSLLDGLHAGPKQRGTTRNQFDFNDGSTGDVYRCVLLAIKADPSQLSFTYDDIYQRTRAACVKDAPAGSSVSNALEQIHDICLELEPSSSVLEWNEEVLDIVDPYFLYYLRCSPRLESLGRESARAHGSAS